MGGARTRRGRGSPRCAEVTPACGGATVGSSLLRPIALRRLSFSVQTLLAAAVVGLLWHTLQAAEHARVRAEVHGRLAAARGERIVALEGELADALHARDGVREFIRERIATEAAAREAQEQRLRAATQPLPDGLRLAIETLHDLWRRGGHHRLRVLSLRAIEAKELRGLELFEAPDELG